MPNQGDLNRAEPGIPHGTNAGLLSSSGTPMHTDMGSDGFAGTGMHGDSGLVSAPGTPVYNDTGRPSGIRGHVSSAADTGKAKLASTMHDLGDRIEHKGREFESRSALVRPVGRVLNSTGEALEGGANYLRSSDFGVIRDDVVEGIRHRPLLSAGIAFGCGWLLGQMMGGDDEGEERESRDESGRHEEEEEEEEHEENSSDSGMMGSVRGRVANLLASGVASMAARQVRNRIAGR